MDNQVITTIISTSGAVVVGLGGMWISTNQLAKRVDSIEQRMNRLEDRLNAIYDLVNSKFATLDLEIAKLMDKRRD
jgi:predicted RNA-binding protein with PIN domain